MILYWKQSRYFDFYSLVKATTRQSLILQIFVGYEYHNWYFNLSANRIIELRSRCGQSRSSGDLTQLTTQSCLWNAGVIASACSVARSLLTIYWGIWSWHLETHKHHEYNKSYLFRKCCVWYICSLMKSEVW